MYEQEKWIEPVFEGFAEKFGCRNAYYWNEFRNFLVMGSMLLGTHSFEAEVVSSTMGSGDNNGFVYDLEARLRERSDELENLHMEAAIDARLSVTEGGNPIVSGGKVTADEVIFDDYTNPHAVDNCLSPYQPSSADRIEAFCRWVNLTSSDVLLDIGCGDGRVCVVASRIAGMSTTSYKI
jgi:hypothetical protein